MALTTAGGWTHASSWRHQPRRRSGLSYWREKNEIRCLNLNDFAGIKCDLFPWCGSLWAASPLGDPWRQTCASLSWQGRPRWGGIGQHSGSQMPGTQGFFCRILLFSVFLPLRPHFKTTLFSRVFEKNIFKSSKLGISELRSPILLIFICLNLHLILQKQ